MESELYELEGHSNEDHPYIRILICNVCPFVSTRWCDGGFHIELDKSIVTFRKNKCEISRVTWSDGTANNVAQRDVVQEWCGRQRFEKLFLVHQWHKKFSWLITRTWNTNDWKIPLNTTLSDRPHSSERALPNFVRHGWRTSFAAFLWLPVPVEFFHNRRGTFARDNITLSRGRIGVWCTMVICLTCTHLILLEVPVKQSTFITRTDFRWTD